MRILRVSLVILLIVGAGSIKSYGAPAAKSAALWPDAVAVIVDGRLLVLNTQSDGVLWAYDFEGARFHGLVKAGKRLFVGAGANVIVLDRNRIEAKPRTWRLTPPTENSVGLWPLYERAVPLLTDGRYVWGRLDNPSHDMRRPLGAIFAINVGKAGQPPNLDWSGGNVLGDALIVENGYILAGLDLGFGIYDATTGVLLSGVGTVDLHGKLVFGAIGRIVVASTTRLRNVYGYSLSDFARKPKRLGPVWTWVADNETVDIVASPDGRTAFISQATTWPWSTEHYGRSSPRSSVTALNAATGKRKWMRILVPGTRAGMHLPLEDLTLHHGNLLAVTRRPGLGEADELNYYLKQHYAGLDIDDFLYYLYSVNAKTGSVNWKYETQGLEAIAAEVGNVLYLATDQELLTQIRKWSEDLSRAGRPRKSLPDWRTKVQAIDLSSGRLLWSADEAQFLVATENLAYMRIGDGSVVAVDGLNGKVRYRYKQEGVP